MNHPPRQTSAPAPAAPAQVNPSVLRAFTVGIALVGCLFLVFSLAKPHRTGIVTSVGRVSAYTARSGTGTHASTHRRYASDVKVRVKGTSETATVYYRVGRADAIPAVGDEIEFADSPLVGNTPYPQMWAVRLGLILIALDLAACVVRAICRRMQARRRDM